MSDSADDVRSVLIFPQAPVMGLFRELEAILKEDDLLQAGVSQWRSFKGTPEDWGDLPSEALASVLLYPSVGPSNFEGPNLYLDAFLIEVELQVNSPCVDDTFNLWHAIRQALYRSEEIRQRLISAGAQSGQPDFAGPSIDGTAGNGQAKRFRAKGKIRVDVRASIYS